MRSRISKGRPGEELLRDLQRRQGLDDCRGYRRHICCGDVQRESAALRKQYKKLLEDMARLQREFRRLHCVDLGQTLEPAGGRGAAG